MTGYHNTWDQVSDQNPAKKWLTDGDPSNDRWVLKQNGAYYFNPAIPQVRELIINGVRELRRNIQWTAFTLTIIFIRKWTTARKAAGLTSRNTRLPAAA